jgi:hypothetical protein
VRAAELTEQRRIVVLPGDDVAGRQVVELDPDTTSPQRPRRSQRVDRERE